MAAGGQRAKNRWRGRGRDLASWTSCVGDDILAVSSGGLLTFLCLIQLLRFELKRLEGCALDETRCVSRVENSPDGWWTSRSLPELLVLKFKDPHRYSPPMIGYSATRSSLTVVALPRPGLLLFLFHSQQDSSVFTKVRTTGPFGVPQRCLWT